MAGGRLGKVKNDLEKVVLWITLGATEQQHNVQVRVVKKKQKEQLQISSVTSLSKFGGHMNNSLNNSILAYALTNKNQVTGINSEGVSLLP